ncbi:EG45-like domain containing protein isoform X4 [Punica granatum]|uniref:EG45-like domain containing protein isoform X4 n=1 Tax=Punica granatum TaxID=22663 RepID=A0A6P8ENK0_PUNGR|nr:EG45-like domain containing protein isoform X4 [Punica granatum]
MPQMQPMAVSQILLRLLIISTALTSLSYGDVGTAARYSPPYTPTACYGNDPSQFPSSNLFGAAGDGIWDNGAACGRQYLVRCISATVAGTCNPSQTIQVRIVDRAATSGSRPSREGATIVLSTTAFGSIANPSATSINVEFQQKICLKCSLWLSLKFYCDFL